RGVVRVRDLELHVAVGELGQGDAVAALHALGLVRLDAQQLTDVLGDVVAADGYHGRVRQRASAEDADVGGAAADVDEDRGELLLAGVQDGEPGGQRLDHEPVHGHAGVHGAAPEVLQRALRPGDDVHVNLEPHPRHAL